MFKKTASLLLVILLLIGTLLIAVVSASAADTDTATEAATDTATEAATEQEAIADPSPTANVIYFDPVASGWQDYDTIGFHIWEIDDDAFKGYFWGEKKQKGAPASDGRWYYDLDAADLTIRQGKQYGVIFYAINDGVIAQQTYNLIFGTACIGKTAACEGTIYENPEDSHKTTQAAFWENSIDPKVYGPELQISSIGTVVGTCCPASTTPYELFVDFLHNTLQNARIYSDKSDQKLLDDIGAAIGLTRSDVEKAINENGVKVDWDREKSTLPDDEKPTEAATAAPQSDDVPKSPQTGTDATVVILMMIAAAAGFCIASKKLRKSR